MRVVRACRPLWWTRQYEVMEWGRFRPPNIAGIKASRGWAPVTPRNEHGGGHFSDAVGPTFKVGSCALSFLTTRRPKIWDFNPLPSSGALASHFFRSLAPAAPPPLSPESRSKAYRRHVELHALQCDPLDAALPRRSRAAPSSHRHRGVEGVRGGVHVTPA
jgi:hypothetical protein